MVSQRVRQLNEHGFEDGKEFRQRDGGKNMTKNGDKKIRPGSNARIEGFSAEGLALRRHPGSARTLAHSKARF